MEHFRLHWHSQDRQDRLGGQHAGQVGSPTGSSDDHLQPPFAGSRCIAGKFLRRAMGRDHLTLMRNTKLREDVRGPLHRLPV